MPPQPTSPASDAPPPAGPPGVARFVALGAWVALLVLCAAWELRVAPLRPGGSWLVLKAVPLLFPLAGLARASLRAMQWSTLLVLLYLAEGATRVFEAGPARSLAAVEVALVVVYEIAAFRCLQPSRAAARARRRASASSGRRADGPAAWT